MDIPEISDFEFEEIEEFDDWSNYEILRSDDYSSGQTLASECGSTSHDSSHDTLSTSSSVNDDSGRRKRPRDHPCYENLSPQDRIKLQKQFKLARPRIVKRDFRRDFPMQWVNVTNTCSYDFMMEHINTFYHQDVVLLQRDLRPLDIVPACPEDSKLLSMRGIPVLSEFWYKAMNLAPDLVCKLKHSVLKVRSDGTSTIRCSFVLNGTKIVQLMSGQELKHIQAYADDVKQNYSSTAPAGNYSSNSSNKPEISATVAAMAAVAPTKVRAVLRAQKLTTLPATDARNVMRLPADQLPSSSSSSCTSSTSKSAVLSSRLQALATAETNTANSTNGATISTISANRNRSGSANLSVWDELADMDSTKTAERYIQASRAANKYVQKKRTAKAPKPTKDWFTVVQEPQNVETSVMSMKKLSESQFHIPYTRLMTMCASDENYNSLRAENDAQMGTGMAFTAHTIRQPGSSGEETVVLTGEVDFLCSLELNFNADNKVESLILNYIT